MRTVADQLAAVVQSAHAGLHAITDARASEKPYPDKWSLKEILGHLIDSAANNHQRIVRMQESDNIGRFAYAQQHWVHAQRYQAESWENLVELWFRFNMHLAHIIREAAPDALSHVCDIGYARPATLRFVMEDYVRHVSHHLEQIMSDVDPRKREQWVSRDPGNS